MQMFGLAFLVAAAAAAPQFSFDQPKFIDQGFDQPQFIDQGFVSSGKPEVRIVSQKNVQDQIGNYEYAYDQNNGQKVQEVGRFQPGPEPNTGRLEQEGSYEFVGDDGNTYQVSYRADQNGFQPQAAHLPQPPAQIPEYEQLRREHPEIFWAENQSQGIIGNDQQFVQQPQFDQQQFDGQPQQFDQQPQFDQQQFVQQPQFDQQQFVGQPQQFVQQQQFVQPQQFGQSQFIF